MKRLWLLTVCLCLFLLAGCGAKEDDSFTLPDITQNPVATLVFDTGEEVSIELFPLKAPQTVSTFIHLANTENYYDGLNFHRMIQDVMMQGGASDGQGYTGSEYLIKGEFAANDFEENDLKHEAGTISMARVSGDNNSASGQFFICVTSVPAWDGEYAAFGKVTQNLEAIQAFCSQPLVGSRPMRPPVIQSLRVETFGVEYPAPEKPEATATP